MLQIQKVFYGFHTHAQIHRQLQHTYSQLNLQTAKCNECMTVSPSA